MPFFLIILLLFVGGGIVAVISFICFCDGLRDKNPSKALNYFICFILLGLLITSGAFWMYYSYYGLEISEEEFCKFFIDNTVANETVQCVRIGDTIFNLNKELGCIVSESSIIRVYKFGKWKYGIWHMVA